MLPAESIYTAEAIITEDGEITANNAVLTFSSLPDISIAGTGTLTVFEKEEALALPAVGRPEDSSYVIPFGEFTLKTTFIPNQGEIYAFASNFMAQGGRVQSHGETSIVFPNFVDTSERPSYDVEQKPNVIASDWTSSGQSTLFLQFIDFVYETQGETHEIRGSESQLAPVEGSQVAIQQVQRAAILEGDFTWTLSHDVNAYTDVEKVVAEELQIIGSQLQSNGQNVLTNFAKNGNKISFTVPDPEAPFNYWPFLALLMIPFLFVPTPRRVRTAYQKEKYGYVARFGPWFGARNLEIAAMVASAKIQKQPDAGRAYLQSLPEARKPGAETELRLETEALLREGKRDQAIDQAVALLQRNIEAERPLGFHEIVVDIRIQRVLRGLKH